MIPDTHTQTLELDTLRRSCRRSSRLRHIPNSIKEWMKVTDDIVDRTENKRLEFEIVWTCEQNDRKQMAEKQSGIRFQA